MSVANVTETNFKTEVLDSDKPVLIDFWGEGCPPCKIISPIVEKIAEEYAGKIKVLKAKVDDNLDKLSELEIMGVPTLVVYNEGRVYNKHVGMSNKEVITDLFKPLLLAD